MMKTIDSVVAYKYINSVEQMNRWVSSAVYTLITRYSERYLIVYIINFDAVSIQR